MAYREDEEKRIYELETAESLSAGTFVPVDKEGNEMAEKFDLGTALGEKVDAPSTAPEAGQVLTFDGTENTWANPPEGVYMLKYSEVSSIDDIDVNKAVSKPTFMQIDVAEGIEITIPTSSGSTDPYTQRIYKDTILKLDEVGPLYSDETSTYNNIPQYLTFSTNVGSYAGGTFGENADLKFKVIISATRMTGVTKLSRVMGDIELGSILGQQPQPVTKRYRNWRGPVNAYEGNSSSMVVEFQQGGRVRTQLLPGAELASHDFSNDSTPEQIQFMGWGATSNRAGYKNLITAQHNYDSTNFPIQTPQVQFLKFKMSGGTPESDQVMNVVQATMKSADGQNTEAIGGILVPSLTTISGALQYWSDSNGSHYGWKPVNEVPASTAQDEGKVLTVNSAGVAGWSTPASGSSVEIVSVSDYSSSTSDLYDYLVSLFNAGKTAILKYDAYNTGTDSYYTITRYSHTQYDTPKILAISIPQAISLQSIGEEMIESGEELIETLNINSSGYTWNYRRVLDLIDNGTKSESDISSGKIDITRNNTNTIVTLTSVSALTLNVTFYGIPNLVIELDNTGNQSNVTLTLKDGTNNTMKHSTSAGNVAQAGKYYQVTAVGNCWTMAEFEA